MFSPPFKYIFMTKYDGKVNHWISHSPQPCCTWANGDRARTKARAKDQWWAIGPRLHVTKWRPCTHASMFKSSIHPPNTINQLRISYWEISFSSLNPNSAMFKKSVMGLWSTTVGPWPNFDPLNTIFFTTPKFCTVYTISSGLTVVGFWPTTVGLWQIF